MTQLRLLIDAPPQGTRDYAYALQGTDGQVTRRGRAALADLPRADAVVAIIDAPLVHVTTLSLPPIAANRLADAVRFALDDQLATATEALVIRHTSQRRDGRVQVVALAPALLDAIVRALPGKSRVVALPTLLPVSADWQWARDAQGKGFALRPDGSAIALPSPAAAPAELALAVNQARRAGSPPRSIVAHAPPGASVATPSEAGGVPVIEGPSWDWDGSAAVPADTRAALDLVARAADPGAGASPMQWQAFRAPAMVASVAALLFVAAAAATWVHDAVDRHRDEQRAIELARSVGAQARDFGSAVAAVDARHAEARHAAREWAPGDALPLLARAAPALATLRAGQWKRAVYGGGAWTLELAPLDAPALDALIARLTDAGLTALHASTATGVRIRIQA